MSCFVKEKESSEKATKKPPHNNGGTNMEKTSVEGGKT
jgi:hypothetical protein